MKHVLEPIHCDPWMLDPEITYLNHGSFGARVVPVFEYQEELKQEFERSPVHFLDRQHYRLEDARKTVSTFLGADVDGFGFVDNATTGIGCVVQSLSFKKGDEILTSSLVYNGVRQLLSRIAGDSSCSYKEFDIALPVLDCSVILQSLVDAITDNTKLLVIDHVASASAIIFPVDEIVTICKEKGVLVLIDGAHAPGMLDLDINRIDADWYVGNLHKWVCAPIGAGFVYASKRQRECTHPMTVSHGYGQGFTKEFDWQGSKDLSPWIASAKAVEWGTEIGWDRIREHNHALAVAMHDALIDAWGVPNISPCNGSMLGTMATVLLPNACPQDMEGCLQFRDQLYHEYNIEVPVFELQGKGVLRISAQLYTQESHIYRLLRAIENLTT
jgi:isopenicillin-N epimerase